MIMVPALGELRSQRSRRISYSNEIRFYHNRRQQYQQRHCTTLSTRRFSHFVAVFIFVTLFLPFLPNNNSNNNSNDKITNHNYYGTVEASSSINNGNSSSSVSSWLYRHFRKGGSNHDKKEPSAWSRLLLLFRNGKDNQSSGKFNDGDTATHNGGNGGMNETNITSFTANRSSTQQTDAVANGDTDSTDTDNLFFSTSQRMTQKRSQFLDRIAILASSIMRKDVSTLNMEDANFDLDGVTPQSDLSRPGRYIHIVTTATLPWFTGTAVNPLLRAAYLHRTTQQINSLQETTVGRRQNTTKRWVTLVIPWLELPEDQMMLYNGRVFANCTEQEQYIRDWLQYEANMTDVACPNTGLQIIFYPGRYHTGLGSIFAMGDIIDTIVNSTATTSTATSNSSNDTMTEFDTTTCLDDNSHNENSDGHNLTAPLLLLLSNTTGSSGGTICTPKGEEEETIPPPVLDVCVLEEPEHCNWYRAPGDGWTKRFNYVVGIVHTNYKEYASSHYSGLWTAPAIALMSSAMIRAYCHKVIKLSNTLQSYAVEKESTSNVHGVRSHFWQEGLRRSKLPSSSWDDIPKNPTSIYFIGKLLWAKGLDLMLELEDYYKQYTGEYFPIDIFGSGPDQRAITRAFHGRRNSVNANPKKEAEIEAMDKDDDICEWDDENALSGSSNDDELSGDDNVFWSGSGTTKNDLYIKAKQKIAQFKATINTAVDIHEMTKEQIAKIKDTINNVELPTTFSELRRQPIPANFLGRVDHGMLTSSKYRIFCNPSISEVLCTTTAEALAMGKYAIIPVHPSNTFFLQFPNCLAYRNKFEFVANLRWALTHDPEPLTLEQIHQFTWEAATERFIAASAITWREALERERLGLAKLDERIAWFHNELGKGETGDFLRKVLGAGPASHQVKYQKEKHISASSNDGKNDENNSRQTEIGEDDEDEGDDEESGFNRKFRRSSFAEAIRAAVKDFSSFGIQ